MSGSGKKRTLAHRPGFRKGYSIVDNAKIHVEKEIVVNIDIANFFPNIPSPN